jgi:hypothetical protein
MEKQTKILLGVGAVIAAYLILKPKKVIGQTAVVMPTNGQTDGGYDGSGINPHGFYSKDIVDMSQSDNIGNNLYKYNGKTYSITRERLDYDYPNGMPAFGWKCVDQNGNECDLKNFPI